MANETMKFVVVGSPRIEREYCDNEFETVMVIDLKRSDGETGDVWIVAGVPNYLQSTAQAAGTQRGVERVRVFGDCPDHWCPETFRPANGDYQAVSEAVVEACTTAALAAHHERIETL